MFYNVYTTTIEPPLHNPLSENNPNLQLTVVAYQLNRFSGIQKASLTFKVPYSAMNDHIAGMNSWAQAHELKRNLSNTKESTSVQSISHLTSHIHKYSSTSAGYG